MQLDPGYVPTVVSKRQDRKLKKIADKLIREDKALSRKDRDPLTGKLKKRLQYIRVIGYDNDGNIIDEFPTRIRNEDGSWNNPKGAKKLLKKLGATVIVRRNVWETQGA